jgi:hypothetical protein
LPRRRWGGVTWRELMAGAPGAMRQPSVRWGPISRHSPSEDSPRRSSPCPPASRVDGWRRAAEPRGAWASAGGPEHARRRKTGAILSPGLGPGMVSACRAAGKTASHGAEMPTQLS